MTKYVLPGSLSLMIISIIALSSFIKDKPSYIGIASMVTRENMPEPKKEHSISYYEKRSLPEITPIVLLNPDTAKPDSVAEIKTPVKKEAVKKKKKKREIITPVKEEITALPADTFVSPAPVNPDTLTSKMANDESSEPQKKKKKRKKFLFF